MSVPFGVSVTLVSGQDGSAECVLTASVFMTMCYLSIYPVCPERDIRDEFLLALSSYGVRENIYFFRELEHFAKGLIDPDSDEATKGLFWLALDQAGEEIARETVMASGKSPEESIYHIVPRLNLLEQPISPPPQVYVPVDVWKKTLRNDVAVVLNYRKERSNQSLSTYMDVHAPLLPEQKLYHEWFRTFQNRLMPWRTIIQRIQSDVS